MSRQQGWPYKKEFSCHRCGNCCRGDGYVDVTESDIERGARELGMTAGEFIRLYCKRQGNGTWGLIDQGDDLQSCVMLTEEDGLFGCRIHKAKPEQCIGFPFTWRPRDAINFCAGVRAAAGLDQPKRKTMNSQGEKRRK